MLALDIGYDQPALFSLITHSMEPLVGFTG
jgi:hypothetical protein